VREPAVVSDHGRAAGVGYADDGMHAVDFITARSARSDRTAGNYLWRDTNFPGRIVRHKTIVGTVEECPTRDSASEAINGLRMLINAPPRDEAGCCDPGNLGKFLKFEDGEDSRAEASR
jgi:hypothetical protein